jgi:hypothetical protein
LIRHGRGTPPSSLMIVTVDDAVSAKKQIAEAYDKIR